MDWRKRSQETYDRASRTFEGSGPDPNLRARRAVEDAVRDERHRGWDLAAKDKTPKSARHHWAVVGEGSRTALENFLNGYSNIDWST